MLEQLKEEVTIVRKSEPFKEFKNKSPNAYLCAGFLVIETLSKTPWQIDFYCPDRNVMTTFTMNDDVSMKETDNISKTSDTIPELNLDKVDYDFEDVLKTMDELLKEKYAGHKADKIITILQNMQGSEVWNVTYLTNQFHVLNVKVNAEDGNLISEKMSPIMSFKA